MYVCMYVYVCMHVCMYVYIHDDDDGYDDDDFI